MRLRQLFKSAYIVALSILTFSCSQQKTEWQGTIEEVDGVTVVKNPTRSVYEPGILEITKDLTIKEEKDEGAILFEMLAGLCVDDEENIYALDNQAGCIKVFDRFGKHKFNIGAKGEGPGEFNRPLRIQFIAPDKILVLDIPSYRLTWYLTNGDFLRVLPAAVLRPSRIESDFAGNLIARVSRRSEDKYINDIKKYDSQLKEEFPIASLAREPTPSGKFPMQIPLIQFHVAPNGNIVWGNESKYEFFFIDEYGETVRKIIKDYIPLKISESDKERMIEQTFGTAGVLEGREPTFPDNHLPFNDFLINDDGMIIVRTYEYTAEGKRVYDIFDDVGRYIVSTPLIRFPRAWKNSKLYFIESDEDGFQYISRYNVTWNY